MKNSYDFNSSLIESNVDLLLSNLLKFYVYLFLLFIAILVTVVVGIIMATENICLCIKYHINR